MTDEKQEQPSSPYTNDGNPYGEPVEGSENKVIHEYKTEDEPPLVQPVFPYQQDDATGSSDAPAVDSTQQNQQLNDVPQQQYQAPVPPQPQQPYPPQPVQPQGQYQQQPYQAPQPPQDQYQQQPYQAPQQPYQYPQQPQQPQQQGQYQQPYQPPQPPQPPQQPTGGFFGFGQNQGQGYQNGQNPNDPNAAPELKLTKVNRIVWFLIGFAGGFFGVLAAFLFSMFMPPQLRRQIYFTAFIGFLAEVTLVLLFAYFNGGMFMDSFWGGSTNVEDLSTGAGTSGSGGSSAWG